MSKIKRKKNISKRDAYYLRLIENSKDILYLISGKTGKFEYVSPSTKQISGFSVEEIIRMGMEGINMRAHPDDMRVVEHRILDMVAKGSLPPNYSGNLELRFKHKDGHYLWFGITRNFITDSDGRINACVGSIRDIDLPPENSASCNWRAGMIKPLKGGILCVAKDSKKNRLSLS